MSLAKELETTQDVTENIKVRGQRSKKINLFLNPNS